jgi:hypothetical protein
MFTHTDIHMCYIYFYIHLISWINMLVLAIRVPFTMFEATAQYHTILWVDGPMRTVIFSRK